MTVNFRKSTAIPTYITLGDSDVNTVESSCFLSTIISEEGAEHQRLTHICNGQV